MAKNRYIEIAKKVIEYFSDQRTISLNNKEVFLKKLRINFEDAAQAIKKMDVLNVVVLKNINQPILLFLLMFVAVISVIYLKLSTPVLLGIFYIFYRALPRLLNVTRGYGDILSASPIDVIPEIERWKKLKSFKRK